MTAAGVMVGGDFGGAKCTVRAKLEAQQSAAVATSGDLTTPNRVPAMDCPDIGASVHIFFQRSRSPLVRETPNKSATGSRLATESFLAQSSATGFTRTSALDRVSAFYRRTSLVSASNSRRAIHRFDTANKVISCAVFLVGPRKRTLV